MSSPTPTTQEHLFLRRNLSQRARNMPDVELVEMLKALVVTNGLECKISCANSKVCVCGGGGEGSCHASAQSKMSHCASAQSKISQLLELCA